MCFVEFLVTFLRCVIAIIAASRGGENERVFYSNLMASQSSQINFPVEMFLN